MSSINDDDGVLTLSTPIRLASAVFTAKSGRRDNASSTTFNLPGLYSTRKSYSAKNDNHLAIRCEICGDFTAVRSEAWSV
ncbi:hypothetical protein PC128_g26452 [Phytophthora cactorum]|nr:hypothetical protein PC128_g26452 [Phytophthora cactorum]